jgi:hypothetical protein
MQIFVLLGMQVQTHALYLLPFLRHQWRADRGLDDDALALLRSTALLLAKKVMQQRKHG